MKLKYQKKNHHKKVQEQPKRGSRTITRRGSRTITRRGSRTITRRGSRKTTRRGSRKTTRTRTTTRRFKNNHKKKKPNRTIRIKCKRSQRQEENLKILNR